MRSDDGRAAGPCDQHREPGLKLQLVLRLIARAHPHMLLRTARLLPNIGNDGGHRERRVTGHGDHADIRRCVDRGTGDLARLIDDFASPRKLILQHRFATGFEGDDALALLAREQRPHIDIDARVVRDEDDQRIAELPGLQRIELDRFAVFDRCGLIPHRDAERLLEESLRGVLERTGEFAHGDRGGWLGFGRPLHICGGRSEAGELGVALARERSLGPSRVVRSAGCVLEGLEAPGLQRMTTQQVAGLLDAEGLREQVGEFLDDDRERDCFATRRLEAAPVDQERVAGAEQRFEEQVPVEAATVVFLRLRCGKGVPGRGP